MSDEPKIKPYWQQGNRTLYCGDAMDVLPQLPGRSVDLVFGSPPYCEARTYGIGAQRGFEEWVAWMLDVTTEAARVSRGPVVWVVWGVTRKRNYWPAPEALMVDWFRRGGDCQLYRPAVFHRVGICGSGGDDWLRADWEYILCFKRPGKLPWSNNTAAGHPPKWAQGGAISHRLTDGHRRNQWGAGKRQKGERQANGTRQKSFRSSHRPHTKRRTDGTVEVQDYTEPTVANPGNLFTGATYLREVQKLLDQYERGDVRSGTVGGGQMGDDLAHKNEAPFPEWLAEVFVASFCPPGGMVLDPFIGSGTTLAVAQEWGRGGIGIDLRKSQCKLTKRRLSQARLPFGVDDEVTNQTVEEQS